MAGKKTRGRQKIEMKKIEHADERLVTFSKRKSGIFKKCNEIATLCGAEVGAVVFSETQKPFSYGHPSIESIADRFINQQQSQETTDNEIAGGSIVAAYKHARFNGLLNRYNELDEKLRDEQHRQRELKQIEEARAGEGQGWWQRPIKELDLGELKKTYASFQQLHEGLSNHLSDLTAATHNVGNYY